MDSATPGGRLNQLAHYNNSPRRPGKKSTRELIGTRTAPVKPVTLEGQDIRKLGPLERSPRRPDRPRYTGANPASISRPDSGLGLRIPITVESATRLSTDISLYEPLKSIGLNARVVDSRGEMGYEVIEIIPDSPITKSPVASDLRPGRIIVSANGKPASDYTSYELARVLLRSPWIETAAPEFIPAKQGEPPKSFGITVVTFYQDGSYFHRIKAIQPGSIATHYPIAVNNFIGMVNGKRTDNLSHEQLVAEMKSGVSSIAAYAWESIGLRLHSVRQGKYHYHRVESVQPDSRISKFGLKQDQFITELQFGTGDPVPTLTMAHFEVVVAIRNGAKPITAKPIDLNKLPAALHGTDDSTLVESRNPLNLTTSCVAHPVPTQSGTSYRLLIVAGTQMDAFEFKSGDELLEINGIPAYYLPMHEVFRNLSNVTQMRVRSAEDIPSDTISSTAAVEAESTMTDDLDLSTMSSISDAGPSLSSLSGSLTASEDDFSFSPISQHQLPGYSVPASPASLIRDSGILTVLAPNGLQSPADNTGEAASLPVFDRTPPESPRRPTAIRATEDPGLARRLAKEITLAAQHAGFDELVTLAAQHGKFDEEIAIAAPQDEDSTDDRAGDRQDDLSEQLEGARSVLTALAQSAPIAAVEDDASEPVLVPLALESYEPVVSIEGNAVTVKSETVDLNLGSARHYDSPLEYAREEHQAPPASPVATLAASCFDASEFAPDSGSTTAVVELDSTTDLRNSSNSKQSVTVVSAGDSAYQSAAPSRQPSQLRVSRTLFSPSPEEESDDSDTSLHALRLFPDSPSPSPVKAAQTFKFKPFVTEDKPKSKGRLNLIQRILASLNLAQRLAD